MSRTTDLKIMSSVLLCILYGNRLYENTTQPIIVSPLYWVRLGDLHFTLSMLNAVQFSRTLYLSNVKFKSFNCRYFNSLKLSKLTKYQLLCFTGIFPEVCIENYSLVWEWPCSAQCIWMMTSISFYWCGQLCATIVADIFKGMQYDLLNYKITF